MSANSKIGARVEAFVRDFADWNAKHLHFDASNWEMARKDFATIIERHFVSAENAHGVGCTLGTPSEHSPEEAIVSTTEESDECVTVETQLTEGVTRYYEYTMQKLGSEWRIAKVQTFFGARGERVKDVDLRALARGRSRTVPAKEFPAGLDRLFDRPLSLRTSTGLVRTTIACVGKIEAPSGFLAADDPGSWQWGIAVFDRQIPTGRHDIELVIGDKLKIVGAARIRFQRGKQKSVFARATRSDATNRRKLNSHVIAVDGGIVGLADAGSLTSLSRRDRERLSSALCDVSLKKGTRGAASVKLDSSVNAWAIDSGCGDGGYAAYWQLDEEGRPLSLVLDFVDLAMPIWQTTREPIKVANLARGEIKLPDVAVRFGHGPTERFLTVTSKRATKTKLFDLRGQVIFDSEGQGYSVCGDETTYQLPQNVPNQVEGILEIRADMGHGYQIAEAKDDLLISVVVTLLLKPV